MEVQISAEIINVLENELKQYEESIVDVLIQYTDFKNLDLSDLANDGFFYNSDDRGVAFVDSLRGHLHKKDIDYDISLWIINKWGGIGSFKNNETNENRINKFFSELKKRKLTTELFGIISSLSKIASFADHEKYFVYDSRVVYTLNWLILKNNLNNPVFFPMPESRNAKLLYFDLNTLINLAYMSDVTYGNRKNEMYLSPQKAYFIYCDLVRELNRRLFPTYKPYYLEMLLFTIADTIIFDEIKSSVSIKII
ncbi:MAG: hypothetical protein WC623_07785 [Pedobacter sp.]|uniref:hypothetical protein n=1 Tax=Pedobacter sp. TaxID=1411316 RepID=UPI003565DE45